MYSFSLALKINSNYVAEYRYVAGFVAEVVVYFYRRKNNLNKNIYVQIVKGASHICWTCMDREKGNCNIGTRNRWI